MGNILKFLKFIQTLIFGTCENQPTVHNNRECGLPCYRMNQPQDSPGGAYAYDWHSEQ